MCQKPDFDLLRGKAQRKLRGSFQRKDAEKVDKLEEKKGQRERHGDGEDNNCDRYARSLNLSLGVSSFRGWQGRGQ